MTKTASADFWEGTNELIRLLRHRLALTSVSTGSCRS